jgi:hypothetical protein
MYGYTILVYVNFDGLLRLFKLKAISYTNNKL